MAHMNEANKPNGAAAAALFSAGVGSAVLGIATLGAQVNEGLRGALTWSKAVGPLSGKTSAAVIAWIASWLIIGLVWREKDVKLAPVLVISAVLTAIGLLLTFPPFFELFAA